MTDNATVNVLDKSSIINLVALPKHLAEYLSTLIQRQKKTIRPSALLSAIVALAEPVCMDVDFGGG